jgi:hypothetical protein
VSVSWVQQNPAGAELSSTAPTSSASLASSSSADPTVEQPNQSSPVAGV